MNWIHQDQLEGFFGLFHAVNWIERRQNTPLPNYSILLNFGKAITLTKDLKTVEIQKNEICFMGPNAFIAHLETQDNQHAIIEFNQAFYCLELHDKDLSCDGLLFGAISQIPILKVPKTEAIKNEHLIEILIEELSKKDDNTADMLRLLLKRLIIKSVRLARQQFFSVENPEQEETDIIRKFQSLVEKNFRTNHKVADYAAMLYKSPKTLSNTFKKLHSKSPLQVIQERIILEAKRQIHYTDKPIKEITFELGFSEPAQFSRLFKKVTNLTPSEFKNQ